MKRIILMFAALFLTIAVSTSNALPNFGYSAVAYNPLGQIITGGNIDVDVTIVTAPAIYHENFTGVPVDAFGMFLVTVGTGIPSTPPLTGIAMTSGTSITVKVRQGSAPWVTIVGQALAQDYFRSHAPILIGGGFGADWSLSGNAITSGQFIGTTNNQDLVFKVNNQIAGRLNEVIDNYSFGEGALSSSPSGGANVAFGQNSLQKNTTAHSNSGFGYGSLTNNTSGNYNTALGSWALYKNLSGGHNTAVGSGALYDWFSTIGITTGNDNTAIGYNANVNAGNLNNVIVIGSGAIATASNQTMIGNSSSSSVFLKGANTVTTTNVPNMYVDVNGQIMRSTTPVLTSESDPVWVAAEPNYGNLGQAEVITANWVNIASPWADNEVADVLTITGGTITNTPISGSTGSFTSLTVGGNPVLTTESDPIWVAAEPNYGNLGQTDVITANWDNTANPWADNEVADNLTINGGTITNTTITGGNVTATQTANALTIGTGLSGTAATFDGSAAVTVSLPTVGAAGTYGSATQVPVITTDAQGRVSGVVNTNIAIPQSAVTGLTTALTGKADLSGATFTGAISATNLSGTNSGDVTLAGQNYLSLAGQVITANAVNLASTNVTGTLPVANGGTGLASTTPYAVVAGGTTATGNLQQVSGLGNAGQVLTSNGAGSLPSWQNPSGGSGTGVYSELYCYPSSTFSIAAGNTWYPMNTTYITGLLLGVESASIANTGTGEFTIPSAGVYQITYSISCKPQGNNDELECSAFLSTDGGTTWNIVGKTGSHSQIGGSNAKYVITGTGLMSLGAGDRIRLEFRNVSDADDVDFDHMSIILKKL